MAKEFHCNCLLAGMKVRNFIRIERREHLKKFLIPVEETLLHHLNNHFSP